MSVSSKPLVEPDWLDFALGHLNPVWSVGRSKARVIGIHAETADLKTFVLRPNRHWRGFQPGQFVPVRVNMHGVWQERCYSLTGRPGARTLRIGVKRQPNGRVSNWLHDHIRPGDVVELGEAGGEFLLPETRPEKLLFIAGGSGVTPLLSLTRAAFARDPGADITLLYYARSPADFAYARDFGALTEDHPHWRLHLIPEQGGNEAAPQGRFSRTQLEQLCPDYRERLTYLCGPAGLMQAVSELWSAEGVRERLHREAFGPAPASNEAAAAVPVRFRRAQRTVENNRPSLLETAEAAGLKPAYGCRIGICKTCSCTKLSGVVRDRITGLVNDQPNSRIRICVSEPLGPVTLDL